MASVQIVLPGWSVGRDSRDSHLTPKSKHLRAVQDMVSENRPPFVPIMVTEFLFDTSPDEMQLCWILIGSGFRVQGSGFRVQGLGFRALYVTVSL